MNKHPVLTPCVAGLRVVLLLPAAPVWAVASAATTQAVLLGATPDQAVRFSWPFYALAWAMNRPVWHLWWWWLHRFEGFPKIGK